MGQHLDQHSVILASESSTKTLASQGNTQSFEPATAAGRFWSARPTFSHFGQREQQADFGLPEQLSYFGQWRQQDIFGQPKQHSVTLAIEIITKNLACHSKLFWPVRAAGWFGSARGTLSYCSQWLQQKDFGQPEQHSVIYWPARTAERFWDSESNKSVILARESQRKILGQWE